MNTLRRNPKRNCSKPKRFEDETFVSGAVDRYQHCYDANKDGKYDSINGHEDYYTSRRGHKFTTIEWNGKGLYRIHKRDFTESLLEFTSIWLGMGHVLPSDIVSHISKYLRLSDVDKFNIAEDDEFIVDDDSSDSEVKPIKWCCSGDSIKDDEDEWCSDEETDVESDWSEYSDN